MKKHRGLKKRTPAPLLMLYEVVFSAVLIIALSLLSAIVLSSMKNPTANIKIFSLIILLVCAVVSGFLTSRYNQSILSSIIASLIFTAIMLIISLICAKGAVGGGVFMNYLCYMGTAAVSAFVGGRKKENKHRHRRG